MCRAYRPMCVCACVAWTQTKTILQRIYESDFISSYYDQEGNEFGCSGVKTAGSQFCFLLKKFHHWFCLCVASLASPSHPPGQELWFVTMLHKPFCPSEFWPHTQHLLKVTRGVDSDGWSALQGSLSAGDGKVVKPISTWLWDWRKPSSRPLWLLHSGGVCM